MFAKSKLQISLKAIFIGLCLIVAALFSFTTKSSVNMKTNVKTLIYHKVENFEKWRMTFESAANLRNASGELSYEIGTLHHDPSIAYVINEWSSVQEFHAFLAKPELAEAMKKAGVLEPPTVIVFDKKFSKN